MIFTFCESNSPLQPPAGEGDKGEWASGSVVWSVSVAALNWGVAFLNHHSVQRCRLEDQVCIYVYSYQDSLCIFIFPVLPFSFPVKIDKSAFCYLIYQCLLASTFTYETEYFVIMMDIFDTIKNTV